MEYHGRRDFGGISAWQQKVWEGEAADAVRASKDKSRYMKAWHADHLEGGASALVRTDICAVVSILSDLTIVRRPGYPQLR